MTLTPASVRAALIEQRERTKQRSKTEIKRFIEESDSKITSLQSQISALIELRDSERASVLALHYIASPIHDLPVELLTEIFNFAVEDETYIHDMHRISQVCSDWRRVAHGTSHLWTRTLEIDLCRKTNGADALNTWLARSAQLPVPISLRFRGSSSLNRGIMEEVLKATPRFSYLQLRTTPSTSPWVVKQFAQCKLDGLEELDLRLISMTPHDADLAPINFITVPRLSKLKLINLGARQITVPWDQLTELSLECNSFEVFEAFTQCANLLRAHINLLGRTRLPEAIQHIPVQFSQLHTLSLCLKADLTRLFDCLSTPVLQVLQLTLQEAPWTDTHLTAFQLRAPNITSLEFSFCEFIGFRQPGGHHSSFTITHAPKTNTVPPLLQG
ncbi:hypothetical protein MSAN_01346600 [Mycena sanguinolenta]|uniref:F-box domain-containing protein n=1 Tax=Mycena sanguinolenta TaxID=230812 RepID=A0A8H6YD38_9AGAR|nr:hypothetical protein MSAN_01346600 [Mycena sanguinolenta]